MHIFTKFKKDEFTYPPYKAKCFIMIEFYGVLTLMGLLFKIYNVIYKQNKMNKEEIRKNRDRIRNNLQGCFIIPDKLKNNKNQETIDVR